MNFIQFITTKRFLKVFASSVLIFLVIAWIVLSLLKVYTRHNQVAVVPKFKGLSMDQISEMESSQDFDLVVIDSIYDYTRTPGTVISQDPVPGTKVKPGRSVYLSLVSFVPEKVAMPELLDLSLRQAKALLQTYGLKLGSLRIIPDIAKNAVLKVTVNGQFVKPGTMIRKGSVIDLIIGSGVSQGEPALPFLIGKSRSQAIAELTRLGFVVGNEFFEGTSDSTNARVYMQEPTYIYNKKLAVGTAFSLTYRSDADLNFDEYISSMTIDTLKSETSPF